MLIAGAPNTGMNGQWSSPAVSNVCALMLASLRDSIVPIPWSVKISSSSTWAIRPSRMWALRTPLRTACVQTLDLGDHAAGDRAVGDQRVDLVGGRLADQAGGIVDVAAQALDVGEVHELLGPERLGDRTGDGVGVDVVGLTGWRRCRRWRSPG